MLLPQNEMTTNPKGRKNVEIQIGPVYSQVVENIPMVQSMMKYEDIIYVKAPKPKPGQRQMNAGGMHKKILVPLVTKEGIFLTGFVQRLTQKLRDVNIPVSFCVQRHAPQSNSFIPTESLVLHAYQREATVIATNRKRGVIIAPTGSGKTVLGMGIAKQYPKHNILWVSPTVDLMNQTYRQFIKEFDDLEVGIIGDGITEPSRITIGIVNSLYNIAQETNAFQDKYEIVIVDECHRISKMTGMHSTVLKSVPATLRIGLTATPPPEIAGQMALEGLIGPTIYTVSESYLSSIGKLAVPKIKIVRIPQDKSLSNYKKYTDLYSMAIVKNQVRNSIIADEIGEQVRQGNTCLVIVRIIDHGENIFNILSQKYPNIRAFYAHGKTESEEREMIRLALQHRTIDVAITSTIWKEGVDIPTLNTVINAAGSKSEIFCLQVIGRGMRASPGKDEFTIIDFFDPSSHYLVDHFGHRISLYFEKGWM